MIWVTVSFISWMIIWIIWIPVYTRTHTLVLPELHVGPYQPGLHWQTSGETHSPPCSQCLLHTTDEDKWILYTCMFLNATTVRKQLQGNVFSRLTNVLLTILLTTYQLIEAHTVKITYWFHIWVPRSRRGRYRGFWPDRCPRVDKAAHSSLRTDASVKAKMLISNV